MPDPELADGAWRLALAGGAALLALGLALARRPERVVGRPRRVLAAVGLLALLAAAVLVRPDPPGLRLALDASTEPLLPPDDPARALHLRAVQEFGDDEIYAIAMESEDGAFARASLETLVRLHHEIARLPGVRRVQSLADAVTFRYDPAEDWIDVGRLFDAVPVADAGLAALRARALADPLLRRHVVSEDGRTAGVTVRFAEMTDAEFIASGLDDRIQALLAAEARPGLRFHVSGRPHLKASVYRGMVHDLSLLVPLALAVLATVLALATGSRRGVGLPLASVAVAVLWTHAVMTALGVPITILSSMLGPQLMAIGSVYGVHVLSHYQEERATGTAEDVARRTLAAMRLPVVVSGTTTWIGFAAVCLTDVPAVRDMGAFSALGTGAISLLTLTALPAALALLPPRREAAALPARLARSSEALALATERLLAALHAAVARRPDAWIAGAVAAAGISAWAVPRIVVDTDYVSFFAEDAPVRRDFDAVNRLLAGVVPLYVVVEGDGPGAFREPAALRALESLQARIDRIEGVSRTASAADLLRSMNRAVEADDPAAERIPDERPAVGELLQLAPKDELGRFLNGNQSRANLVVRTGEVGSAAIRRLTASLRAALRAELDGGLSGEPTGNAILLARSADAIAGGQARAVSLATVAIFALVAGALRSWRLGLVALLPNLFPVLLFFGLLGLGVAPLSLPTSLIGAVALGVAIDDTVHYLVRYRRERARGAGPQEATRCAGQAVGRAIVVTSAMLAAGFAVMALSSFATLREFGLLFALTVGLCVVADLLLLPALLVRLRV